MSGTGTAMGPMPWPAVLAGLAASLVGIGLARFAYTPLLPALIEAGWFQPSAAAYLGAANLAGYLLGALAGRRLAARVEVRLLLRLMLLLATLAFLACSFPSSFAWFFVWRFLAGFAGAVLMVLAAPLVLPAVPDARRGLASGVIFTGVGLGIAASGTLVPLLLRQGLGITWIGLGLLALLLTVLTWRAWPEPPMAGRPKAPVAGGRPRRDRRLLALYAIYGLLAFGLVPHMVFLVDHVARGLGLGMALGAFCWVLFGIGAVTGPIACGRLADRIGFGRALRCALVALLLAVTSLAWWSGITALALSSLVAGALLPGTVALVLGRCHELVPATDHEGRRAAWSFATIAYAVGQAIGAYGLSYLYAHSEAHAALFLAGGGAVLLALLLDLAVGHEAELVKSR